MRFSKIQIAAIAAVIIVLAAGAIYVATGMQNNSKSTYGDGAITIVTPVDYNDNTASQVYSKIPERVVVGCNTALDALLYFGLGDRIIGMYYIEEDVPDELKNAYGEVAKRIGDDHILSGNISQAVLTDWEPDCVIGWVAWSDSKLGSTSYWNAIGCNVWSLRTMVDMNNMEGMKLDYDNIGNIFDVKDKTDAFMAGLNGKIANVKALLSEKSVNYAMEDGVPDKGTIWFYNKAFINNLLKDWGIVNVFEDTGSGTPYSVAYDRADKIDVLFVICYRTNTLNDTVDAWKADPVLSSSPAIVNGKYYAMNLSISYGADPTVMNTLDILVSILSR
jgi:iron complex transport system substrate-binding protein